MLYFISAQKRTQCGLADSSAEEPILILFIPVISNSLNQENEENLYLFYTILSKVVAITIKITDCAAPFLVTTRGQALF